MFIPFLSVFTIMLSVLELILHQNETNKQVKQQQNGHSSFWVATKLTNWFSFFSLAKLIWFSYMTSQECLFYKSNIYVESKLEESIKQKLPYDISNRKFKIRTGASVLNKKHSLGSQFTIKAFCFLSINVFYIYIKHRFIKK